ncbi:MAG: 5-oxoprolinase subunit PxpA [Bacteroidota bacterium]
MEGFSIDINCDVGEGTGNEEDILPYVSSCNIACGGHAGDANSMRRTARLAKANKVKVGAHPSYPDKENFGRKMMHIGKAELLTSIKQQLAQFVEILDEELIELHHIKPHGALYNAVAKDPILAKLFLQAVEIYRKKVLLYMPYGSVAAKVAVENGFQIRYEAFGDRNYRDDLSLVPRTHKKALIVSPEQALRHVLPMIKRQVVHTINEKKRKILADTLCIHSDTPSALKIIVYLSKQLPKYEVQIVK